MPPIGQLLSNPAVISSLISGGASLLNTITNNRAQKKAIEAQNEYNSPFNQMSRYQAAGLNPNLIYGSGQASAGNQTSLGDYRGMNVSTSDAVNMANAILQFKNMDSNIRKTSAEAQSVELDNQHKSMELGFYNERLSLENELKRLQVLYNTGALTTQQYQQRVQLAQIDNILANTKMTNFQRESYYPTLLSIQKQNANTAAGQLGLARERFGWDKSEWNPDMVAKKWRNIFYQEQYKDVDRNRFLNFLGTVIPFTSNAYNPWF